jgi:hypothetical protein
MSSSANQTVHSDPIHLQWTDGERQVVLHPEDGDRHVQTVSDMLTVGAILGKLNTGGLGGMFERLQEMIQEWLGGHKDRIQGATLSFCPHRVGRVQFVVQKKAYGYDAELEDSLADLDLQLANERTLQELNIESTSLPPVTENIFSGFCNSVTEE